MERIDAVITSYNERSGILNIVADYPNADKLVKCGYKTCSILLNDEREITPEQRKKAYALLNEIADYMGEMPEYAKKLFKIKFIHEQMKGLCDDIFSLSDCDVTLARDFITYLVDFIIAHDIPTRVPLSELCDDVKRYVYSCALNKKCSVCGRKAEIHHIDRVGMGNNRDKINHMGMLVLPLCREHHIEAETSTDSAFMKKYHLEAIRLDEKLCKKWRLKHET